MDGHGAGAGAVESGGGANPGSTNTGATIPTSATSTSTSAGNAAAAGVVVASSGSDGGSDGSDGSDGDSSGNGDALAAVRKGASVRSSVTNLTNTILGAGMLGMPQALKNSGLGLGLVILGCVGCLSITSINVLQVTAAKLPPGTVASYCELSRAAFPRDRYGPWPVRLTSAILALACFSYMCSFMIIIADTAAPLVSMVYVPCRSRPKE